MPPFGTMLRAWRLRYSFCPSRNCFIRVQDRSHGFCVEIVPPVLKLLANGKGEYRVIPMGQGDELFDLSPAMRMIRKVKRPIELFLDDSGQMLGASHAD